MFVGHLGAGLILRSPNRRIGLGTLFFCAMALDFILWILVLARVEAVIIPQPFTSMLQVAFNFPYSHSLLASILWSLLAAAIIFWRWRELSSALLAGAAVFSHFILDWLVHAPELPVVGNNSAKLGLNLWQTPALAWSIESAIAVAAVCIYILRNHLSRPRKISLIIMILLLTIMTIMGQASKTPPPSAQAMAATSLATIIAITAFGRWIDARSSS